ncbi:unnamed protein product [Prorocentrum cordatum]|uniref:Uncharacterized protein n=1 Tax=Prorocentrum cordatum TaxID=2364126 RepID=A0ABN9PUB1_9DINO|nr:unnamed protein product [Polarella glacialis]
MAAARQAAQLGGEVAILDFVKPSTQGTSWSLGGTCVNVGCVPKKLMHYAALCREQLADATALGWDTAGRAPSLDWKALVQRVQDHVKKLNVSYRRGLDAAGLRRLRGGETLRLSEGSVTYYNALARFVGPNEVAFRTARGAEGTLTAPAIVVATGGRPRVPREVPGALQHAITSDDVFSLPGPPGKTLCVGGAYISGASERGLGCAGFLTGLGFETAVAVRSRPLRAEAFDKQCVNKVVDLMARQGTRFLRAAVERVERRQDGRLDVHFAAAPEPAADAEAGAEPDTTRYSSVPPVETFDTVLYATGRSADTERLGLAAAGVVVGEDGKIPVDDGDATSVPHIYAIGDVVEGSPELTPTAVRSGELLMSRLFGASTARADFNLVPSTVFTPFEYGRVGMSEEQARRVHGSENIEVFLSEHDTLELGAVGRVGRDGRALEGNVLAKLVCHRGEGMRVLGVHFVGPAAGEVTQGFALALRLGATKRDFDELIGIHPTDAEAFAQLRVAKSSREEWKSVGGCGGGTC